MYINQYQASQMALTVKNPPVNAGFIRATGSIPGWRRPSGGGHGNQFSILPGESHEERELSRLQSIESHRGGHDWSGLAHTNTQTTISAQKEHLLCFRCWIIIY